MKIELYLLLLALPLAASSQHDNLQTDTFRIDGKVKNTFTFSLKDDANFSHQSLDSLVIYNHLHERKRVIRNIKGILLKDLIDKAGFAEDKPKLLSEFFFTCIATDGYKVVFSWNELYNTDIGNHVLVLTAEDGKNAAQLNDHIAILSASDQATGRRYVHNLGEIRVERTQ